MRNTKVRGTETTLPMSEQATSWWVTLHSEDATPADHAAFGEWVARSPERVEAYLHMARLMRALKSDGLKWPDTPIGVLIREAKEAPPDVVALARESSPDLQLSSPSDAEGWGSTPESEVKRFIGMRLFAVAASLLLAIFAVGFFLLTGPDEYKTALGEQRSVLLADGSLITLNTASTIEVDLKKHLRVVRLVKGEALFQVAHDRSRPFDVIAGETTVRAVGTQFNVYREGAGASANTVVTVVEGKVEIDAPQTPHPSAMLPPSSSNGEWSRVRNDSPVFLSAGERVIVTASSVSTPERLANLAPAIAWTQRRLVFERRPLGEVAEEFNRYNRETIQIDDPDLQHQEVTGVFQANDPDSFMVFLSQIPGVKIQKTKDHSNVVTLQGEPTPGTADPH